MAQPAGTIAKEQGARRCADSTLERIHAHVDETAASCKLIHSLAPWCIHTNTLTTRSPSHSLCCTHTHTRLSAGVEGLAVGDRVGYTTRSVSGGSYAEFTPVKATLVTKLPESVSTQDAAAVLLQGLTALSQATVAVANEIKQGGMPFVYM